MINDLASGSLTLSFCRSKRQWKRRERVESVNKLEFNRPTTISVLCHKRTVES